MDSGIACHRMRSADNAVLHSVRQSVSRQVQTSMELVRLDADNRYERGFSVRTEEFQIIEIGLNVFVNDVRLNQTTIHLRRRHAPHISNGAVRHESASEPFHFTREAVLAGFDDHYS